MSKFTCALCGETYLRALSEEEAITQLKDEFPLLDITLDDCVEICDDCFKRGYEGPEFYQEEERRDTA